MPFACTRLVLFCLILLELPSGWSRCDDQTINRYQPGGWPKELDINLYWIGPDDKTEKANYNGQPSDFYDPNKNTVILIDGWDGWDKVSTCHRMSTRCFSAMNCPIDMVYSRRWLEQGWNFGIFYWDQFADTTCTIDAEAVIWDKDMEWRRGPWSKNTMPWKSYDVVTEETTSHVYTGPETSVGQICANLLRKGMSSFRGKRLQLVGLSLGAQLVTSCAYDLHQTPNHPVLPTRLTLLDPIFTEFLKGASPQCFGRGWDYKYTTRRTMKALRQMWLKGVPMELYKSSIMTEWRMLPFAWNPALEMETLGTTTYLDPRYCGYGMMSYHCRHEAGVPLYFSMMGVPYEDLGEKCTVPGPRCSDSQLRNMIIAQQAEINKSKHRVVFHQMSGRGTVQSEDDTFEAWIQNLPTEARLPTLQAEVMVPKTQSNKSRSMTAPKEAAHNFGLAKVASPDSITNTDAVASKEIEHPPVPILIFAIIVFACCGIASCYAVTRMCFTLRINKRSCQIARTDSDLESLTWSFDFRSREDNGNDNESINETASLNSYCD